MVYPVVWKGYLPEHDSCVPFTEIIETDIIAKHVDGMLFRGPVNVLGLSLKHRPIR